MFLCVFCQFKNDVSFNIGNIQNIVVFERYRLEIASVFVLLFSLRLAVKMKNDIKLKSNYNAILNYCKDIGEKIQSLQDSNHTGGEWLCI